MKNYILPALFCLVVSAAKGQHTVAVSVNDTTSKEALIGATVSLPALAKAASTTPNGEVRFVNVPAGVYLLRVSFVGYRTKTDSITVPASQPVIISLDPLEGAELDEVVVSSTRTSRTISNIPTRIEVIAGEELDEKGNMKPGDIRMILNESTGIQTQQTSATSANASIRIQGLDGRYTQILKDGFPVFSGAAAGLGLLQTPPLDLKQVEVIKGSASTLYGGGAIAGLVNLVSKTPGDERELNALVNGTSAGGLDLSAYYSQRYGAAGVTVFASRNSNAAYAPRAVDFTAIPKFERYTLNPRLYLWLGDNTTLNVGLNASFEDRKGGDIHVVEGDESAGHTYFERNNSDRLSSQLSLTHRFSVSRQLTFRHSFSYFNRKIGVPGYDFNGSQHGSFSEVGYSTRSGAAEWVIGANLVTDKFQENLPTSVPLRDYRQTTTGLFVQNELRLSELVEAETGIRGDYVADYGFVLLPRISMLFRISPKLTSRLGGGLGYKTPTIFTEESERIQYRDVLPITPGVNTFERSYGANWDVNYRTALAENVFFSINQLFFYTRLHNPLLMQQNGALFRFESATGHFDSRGMETNAKLAFGDFKLFLGYTLTDARLHVGHSDLENTLTSKHRLNNVLMYEVENKWKLGLEGYYYSRQRLADGAGGKPYWITGFMAERLWQGWSLFVNFENFTDTRQTRFDTIYTGPVTNPTFRDIYAPLDGFVVNGGLKLRLWR